MTPVVYVGEEHLVAAHHWVREAGSTLSEIHPIRDERCLEDDAPLLDLIKKLRGPTSEDIQSADYFCLLPK